MGNGEPTRIVPEEVDSIKAIVMADKLYYPWRYLNKGEKVRVIDGPLAGAVGVVMGK